MLSLVKCLEIHLADVQLAMQGTVIKQQTIYYILFGNLARFH